MKVLTVFGTRPEIIRLSLIIRLLDTCTQQILVHTGQNYDSNLSEIFLRDLGVRNVDHHLGVQASSFGEQAGLILARIDELLTTLQPERVLILGDTNSGLAAIVAARKGIPVYHLEAGNRCYDKRVPEEVNRKIIDHCSDVLLPYTQRSAENLVAEGIRRENIFVVGNPIYEVIEHFKPSISKSDILERLNLRANQYFLVTIHRSENVDQAERLAAILKSLTLLAEHFGIPAVVSVHPRTADRIEKGGLSIDPQKIKFHKPFGLFDFIKLELGSFGIVTDSGTVQEEACLFGIPNVTMRDVTERPETTECGSNILSGAEPEILINGMRLALETRGAWQAPNEYLKENVSSTVAKILLSYRL
jgi:UDP-N-acetylglucosamine 2-epimerase (non-hydrolysing)